MDMRDAAAPQPRGWTRYARDLGTALDARADVDLRRLTGFGGPEIVWEQIGLPLAARRASLLHAPNVFLPLRRSVPGVVTVHDLAFEVYPEDFARRTRAKYRWLAPRACRSAEMIITVSRFTADDVADRYGIDRGKVRVVHNAPSLPVAEGVDGGEPYVLGVGDVRAKKNWRRLAEAVRETDYRLVIAGMGDDPALRSLGVELVGYVDDARLDRLMRGAACVAHPSLYEGYGLVVAEAVARGVPVAAAGNTALPEAGGDAAVYFDPYDVDAIGAAILEAIRRPPVKAETRTWADVAAETLAVYREVV